MARPAEIEKRNDLALRAVDVLERSGLDISMAELARELDIKRPTLLYHFPSLSHIIELALEQLLTEQMHFVLERLAEVADPIDRLFAQLRAIHEFHRGREARIVFLTQSIAATSGERMAAILEVGNRVFEAHRQAAAERVREGIADGRVAPCDADALVVLIRALTDGLLVQRVMTGADLDPAHDMLWTHFLAPLKTKKGSPMTQSAFPESGRSRDEVLADLKAQRTDDLKPDGRAFAFIYDAGEAETALAREAFAACMTINGLDPTTYPSARTIENRVVAACLEILQAPDGAVGTATAGGTESVMLAVKTARDYFAGRGGPRAKAPAMLLPVTAHACFHKAAHYFGIEVIDVAVDPTTFRADPSDARAKMTDNVVLVVGSAPSYAHGVIDPIEELAGLAADNGALMHVDACVGGCVLPFMRELGVDVPPFDFAVDGVTSMSIDLHKYGFAPKGVSVLLQRRRELRDAQYFACATWTGYTIINATTLGSKSVAAMGAAYALIQNLGREGYRRRVSRMWDAAKRLVEAIDETPGVAVLGSPQVNLFAFVTTEVDGETGDLFELADRLAARGWHVQPTYAFGPSPAHIHLTIDPTNASRVDELIADLRAALVDLGPTQTPPPAVVAMLEAMASETGSEISPAALMGQLGVADGRLPGESALIHRLLNAASPAVREALLVLFVGELFS